MHKTIGEEMRALQHELAQIEVRVTSREADVIERLRTDLDVLRGELAAAKGALRDRDAELGRLRDAVQGRDEQVKELQIIVDSKDKIIETIENGCTAMRAEFVRVTAQHEESERRLQEEIKCRDEMLAVLRQRLDAIQAHVEADEKATTVRLTTSPSPPPATTTPRVSPLLSVKELVGLARPPVAVQDLVRGWHPSSPSLLDDENHHGHHHSPEHDDGQAADAVRLERPLANPVRALNNMWRQLDHLTVQSKRKVSGKLARREVFAATVNRTPIAHKQTRRPLWQD
jgi:hypothetical protein